MDDLKKSDDGRKKGVVVRLMVNSSVSEGNTSFVNLSVRYNTTLFLQEA